MGSLIDLVIVIVAVVCAPYMLAGMLGYKLPSFRSRSAVAPEAGDTLQKPSAASVLWSILAPAVAGGLGLLWYGLKRAFAYGWQPEPHEIPRWLQVSSVSVTSSDEKGPNNQTDRQTDPVFDLLDAFEMKQLDKTRKLIIDNAVRNEWGVGQIRALIKGDSGTIGAEVAEAQQRLGITAPIRTIIARQHVDGRLEERELSL